jgi:hypothetical protein
MVASGWVLVIDGCGGYGHGHDGCCLCGHMVVSGGGGQVVGLEPQQAMCGRCQLRLSNHKLCTTFPNAFMAELVACQWNYPCDIHWMSRVQFSQLAFDFRCDGVCMESAQRVL